MSHQNDDIEQQESDDIAASNEPAEEEFASADLVVENRVAVLGGKYDIQADHPLPQYNRGEVKAYRAVSNQVSDEGFFALVCEKHLIPRIHAESIYSSIVHPSLAQLVSNGIAYWPPTRDERFVFVYRDNLGKPVLPAGGKPALGWKSELVINTVVRPMVGVFRDFRDKGFSHGGICPYNFFRGEAEKLEYIILGDCLATPPCAVMPALYETPERAMALGLGRGEGSVQDDLYAFGVSLVVLLRSHDALDEYDEIEVIQQKIEQGTFSTLTSKDRFHGPILDLLRGLLQDDESLRWSVDEMTAWLEGNRPNAKQSTREKKAPRSIVFDDHKYVYCSHLAMHLGDNPAEVVRMVEDQSLEQWLSRSLENEEKADALASAVIAAREFGSGAGYAERLACQVSIALDPHAPIRFDNIRVRGQGLGRLLATSMAKREDLQSYVKLFVQNMALRWASAQVEHNPDASALFSKFDAARTFLRQDRIGYGIERCMYALCPEAPCLSEKLKAYYVNSPEAMMDAFEDICSKNMAPATFLDRHSAAYLFAKDSGSIETFMSDLNSTDLHRRVMGNLKALATIQKRGRLSGFPHICEAFMGMLEPVFARYHDREVRNRLQSEARRFAKTGDLVKMAGLLDSAGVRNKDRDGFNVAQIQYAALSAEYERLDLSLQNKGSFGRATGKNAAALVSCALAIIIILGAVFLGV